MRSLYDGFASLGIDTTRFPAQIAGTYEGKRCVVVATARCVWDDLERLGVKGDENNGWDILCINDIVMHYPGVVKHLYSNQHRWIPHWLNARRETINNYKVREKWGQVGMAHTCKTGARWNWPWPGNGTSTLGGVYTALGLGYAKVVLCGAPLDNSPHYFEPDWCRSNFAREVGVRENGEMMHWSRANKLLFQGRVRSMSGRTRELMGEP